MSRRYYVVLELNDDEYDGGLDGIALWMECAMNGCHDANPDDVEATVFGSLEDFLADHALDALASSSSGSSEVPEAA